MLHIVLTDDWELRGNGSGNPRAMQFRTARALMDLYERFGLRGSFNVEVLQQLAFREAAGKHPELGAIADEWDACVREMLRRGHDVELHTHPQWDGAAFEGGRFRINQEWSLQRCPDDQVRRILRSAHAYLTALGQLEDPAYTCVSYRAGAWALAPSPTILPMLVELGIVFDMSIVAGMVHDTEGVSFDYRTVDEGYRPYYPELADARKISSGIEPIICVPTVTARATDDEETAKLRRELGSVLDDPAHPEHEVYSRAPAHVKVEGADEPLTSEAPQSRPPPKVAPTLAVPSPAVPQALRGIAPDVLVFDLSSLSYLQMRQMLGAVRRRAAAEPGPLPVIIENHTKYLGDMRPVEKFCELLAASDDVTVLTARELARNLQQGLYRIRTRNSLGVSRSSLRAALAGRLESVRARLAAMTTSAASPIPADAGAEEALRQFMVQVFPKAAGGRATDATRESYFALLARLVEPARAGDWRYLDAWNNAFEILDRLGLVESHLPRMRWLLEAYAQLLESRIASLQTAASVKGAGA